MNKRSLTLSTELRREQIVSRVAAALDQSRPFDKDGWTVIAPLMLRFDERGRLLQAATIYDAQQ